LTWIAAGFCSLAYSRANGKSYLHDPGTGGMDGPVTYLAFAGVSGRIADPKDYADHAKVVEIGVRRAKELLADYAPK
jgi:hypothetical protein